MPQFSIRAALLLGSCLTVLTLVSDPTHARGKGHDKDGGDIRNVLHGNAGKGGGNSQGTAAGIGGNGGIAGGGGGTGVGVGSDLGQKIGRGDDGPVNRPSLGGGGNNKSGRPNLFSLVRAGGDPSPDPQPGSGPSAGSSSSSSAGSSSGDSNSPQGGGAAPAYDWDPFASYNAPNGGRGGGSAAPNIAHLNLAEVAAETATAAGNVAETNQTDTGAAEASYRAAKATLAVVRETHFAISDPQGQFAKDHMASAHKAADDARKYAEEAVRIVLKAWPQWPSMEAQSAAAYAQRAADSAAVEVAVADNMMTSFKSAPKVALAKPTSKPTPKVAAAPPPKAGPSTAEENEKTETVAFAEIPKPQRKPTIPVALKQDEKPGAVAKNTEPPAQPQNKGKEAESYEMVAAKANADAQIALIAATTATTQWDAQDNAMAALRASMIAKQAADAAGEAYLTTQIEAKKSLDSVEAQAQAEMASRASQKAFLHAKAAADAANKAYSLSGGKGDPAIMGASRGAE